MVVSDINMPRMDGLTLLQKIQEADDPLSTVIVSAYGDMANIRTAMNRGAFDFLTKPIDFADLETTINKTLRHIEALREARRRQIAAERAHALLSRYFSPNLAERLASDPEAVDLGGQRREITSLFTDMAGFTSLVETLEPEVIAPLLNDYLGGMTDIVFAHGGTVVKIVGDAMHVLFGAPAEQPDHAARAVACALELDDRSQSFRQALASKKGSPRCDSSRPQCRPGNCRKFRRRPVLRLHRLWRYGKHRRAARSGEQAARDPHLRRRERGGARPRFYRQAGRRPAVARAQRAVAGLRAALPRRGYDDPATRAYLDAFRKLEAGDPSALPAFAALLGLRGDDQLVSFHLKRLLNGATGVRIMLD